MAIVAITGASRGIGLALAEGYRRRGDSVIAIVRRSTAELDQLGVEVHGGVDVSDDASVAIPSPRPRVCNFQPPKLRDLRPALTPFLDAIGYIRGFPPNIRRLPSTSIPFLGFIRRRLGQSPHIRQIRELVNSLRHRRLISIGQGPMYVTRG